MCRSRCIAQFQRYKFILQFLDRRQCSGTLWVCLYRSWGLFQPSDATINQLSAGAWCLSVLITKSCFISFWSLAMKSNISVFLFLHWGFTQLTNKRAKKVAWFYSTNLQTYILYILFASFLTIKYDLLFPYPSQYYLLLISKICEHPGLFLSLKCLVESQVQLLRCSIRYTRAVFCFLDFLVVQPVPYICSLAIYTFLLGLHTVPYMVYSCMLTVV